MDILQSIMAERRAAVAVTATLVPVEHLKHMASDRKHHSLKDSLSEDGTRIITEMKKASPSAGIMKTSYEPAITGSLYRNAGAAGISVLTEPLHFKGSDKDLISVRSAVDIPILRKDFMCDPYQIVESAALGADVILIIIAALDDEMIKSLYETAMEYGLDVLAEAHTAGEVEKALKLKDAIIGVNSRNLKTLKTDLKTAKELASMIPQERISVAESGIKTRQDIEELEALGYNGFLIGETLMKSVDPMTTIRELRGE